MKPLLILALSLSPLLASDLEFAKEGDTDLRKRLAKIEGAPAIPINLENWINSDALKLSELKGKIVVLDFWATWCGPCIASIPHNNEMAKKYANDVVFIGICHPRGSEKLAQTVKDKKIEYPVGIDTGSKAINAYKANGFPDYYIIGRDGKVAIADCSNSKVDQVIQKLIASK